MHIRTSEQPKLHMGFGDYTCNWGIHLCGLYENEAERDEILFGFLHQGDRDGDLQMYCPCERTADGFRQEYSTRFPDCADHPDDTDIFQISSARDLYYPSGVFSPWAMDEGLDYFYIQSQRKGQRNVRATAEMVWALDAVPGAEHLMAYESRLNYFIPSKPWISICLYNVTKFSGAVIMDVLRTHPYTISGGVITEDPYYQNPDECLSGNAPQFLRRG